MDVFENKWNPEESDDDYEEYMQNEVPPPELDEKFKQNVLDVKHNLYDSTILAPELGTSLAQSNKTLESYLNKLSHIYILCLNAQKGIINDKDIIQFPEKVREPLQKVLKAIVDFFQKNCIPDTIPYEDYIRKHFHDYQFIQNNSFDKE